MVNILSERIAELRRERGLTQEQLGQPLGVSAQAVSKWEKGGAPDVELLPALADRLGVTIDALFGREGGAVEDMEDTLIRWLISLPEGQRISELCRLAWSSSRAIMNHRMDTVTMPDLKYSEGCTVRVGGEDGSVQVLEELDGLQVLMSAVHVGQPLPRLAVVVQVEHGGHRIYPQAVHVVLLQPEHG